MTAGSDLGGPLLVDYLSVDPVTSTVGSSQVLAYVERLAAHGIRVRLHSFEDLGRRSEIGSLRRRLDAAGVEWRPRRYGRGGPIGGLWRVVRGARALRGAEMVHARSDLAAAAVLLAGVRHWVWDVRSLYVDQKIATGVMSQRSVQAWILRWVERRAAFRSTAVVTLTESAIDELDRRYGGVVGPKASVITTCVDVGRFRPTAIPDGPVGVLISGTLNAYYDVPAMLAVVKELGRRRPTRLVVASPASTSWDDLLEEAGAIRCQSSSHDMPAVVQDSHVGLGICRDDAGVSLLAAMPTKFGEFLAAGRPVVVNAGLVDAAEMVRRTGAGVVHDPPGDPRRTVDALLDVLDDPATGERCRTLALDHFNLETGVARLAEIYRSVSATV